MLRLTPSCYAVFICFLLLEGLLFSEEQHRRGGSGGQGMWSVGALEGGKGEEAVFGQDVLHKRRIKKKTEEQQVLTTPLYGNSIYRQM